MQCREKTEHISSDTPFPHPAEMHFISVDFSGVAGVDDTRGRTPRVIARRDGVGQLRIQDSIVGHYMASATYTALYDAEPQPQKQYFL